MAADSEWSDFEFGLCDTAVVPELKSSLNIGGYPYWYIYHGKSHFNPQLKIILWKGVGYEGECMERFMSSRIDKVEENLRTAAMRAKIREMN